MKCLLKYPWVKLPRKRVPDGKGIMGSWMRLAARAAFRKGEGRYCGYDNPVKPGMWVGGIVGLKAILGVRRRDAALEVLRKLERLGYLFIFSIGIKCNGDPAVLLRMIQRRLVFPEGLCFRKRVFIMSEPP